MEGSEIGLIQPYPALAVTRDISHQNLGYISNCAIAQKKGKKKQIKPSSDEIKDKSNIEFKVWSENLPGEVVKYGRKAPTSAKRTRGHLTNAEKPNDALFWKARGICTPVAKERAKSSFARIRPKSHIAFSVHLPSNDSKTRPRTSKSDILPNKRTLLECRPESITRLESTFSNYVDDDDPDAVSPNHLLDVFEEENVRVPTTGCYSVLSDVSSNPLHSAGSLRPKPVELVVVENNQSNVQARLWPKKSKGRSVKKKVTICVEEQVHKKKFVKGKQHHLAKVERPYSSILDSLRDKYAFDVYTESSPRSPRRNITISNIGETTQINLPEYKQKSDGSGDNINGHNVINIKQTHSFPSLRHHDSKLISSNTLNMFGQREPTQKIKHSSSFKENDQSMAPMVIEIKTVPYVSQSQFYKHLNISARSSPQGQDNSYDVQKEKRYSKNFMKRRMANIVNVRTDPPCNTPQLSTADPSDIGGKG